MNKSGRFDDDFERRFWAKVSWEPNTGCAIWTAAIDVAGYGRITFLEYSEKAHRASYEMEYGPVPDDAHILHSCVGMRCCVNPRHLRAGSHQDNMDDMVRQGRVPRGDDSSARRHPERLSRGDRHWTRKYPEKRVRGERTNTAKLTADKVREIRALYAAGHTQVQLAERFGVTQPNVGYIVRGESWKHLIEEAA